MEPVATPYDIAVIPASPLAPSALAWVILLASGLFLALILFLLLRRRNTTLSSSQTQLHQQIKSCLTRLTEQNTRAIASEAVQALKRYDDIVQGKPSSQQHYQSSSALQALDQLRFSPAPDFVKVKSLLEEIEKSIVVECTP
jgi:hypothetical protein